MASIAASTFKDVRNSLYTDLGKHACVPQVDVDGTITEELERRFFPAGTAEKVLTFDALERLLRWVQPTGFRSTELAQLVDIRKLHVFLAILIASQCDKDALSSFTKKLLTPRIWTNDLIDLAKLPAERIDSLREILCDDPTADIFFQKQHDFFAPIIEKNKETRSLYRRVPYVREKLIGQGSFGRIYEVVISPHHFKDDHSMSNDKPLRLARKDFELNAEERAHEKERDVLREIVRNARKCNNIMKSLGSLEIGSTYSLFMPLADCDLKQYMERYPDAPTTPKEKAKIIQCAVGLADAIVYLHQDLMTQVYEKLSCFHMDLKPQNILVVIDPVTGEQQWKLSDFNMSRVKMKRKPTAEHISLRRSITGDKVYEYEVNKLFKRRIPDAANLSVTDYTINRRGTGTYLAPEACIEGHPVQAESDTWSLGCVISVVFTYLFGGQEAVDAYSDLRGKKDIDRFFTFTGSNGPNRLKNAQVSEAVKRWHQDLRMKTRKRDPQEGAIFEVLIRFLDRSVLVIDPNKRAQTKAVDVQNKLIEAFQAFHSLAIPTPATIQSPKSRLRSFTRRFRRDSAEIELQSNDWKLPALPMVVRSCAFGPNAQPLVCVTDNTLTAYSLDHVLLPNNSGEFGDDLMTYGQVSLGNNSRQFSPNIGVSTQHILARTNHSEFDCYFYRIARPESHIGELELVAHWEYKMPKIHTLAMSPDGQYAAFVLFAESTQQPNGSLYVTQLDWPQASSSGSNLLSIISSSSGSSSNPSSPLGRAIPLLCPAEDVCELKFSAMNGLYVVAKPRQGNSTNEFGMYVYAWSVQDGRRIALPQSPIRHDGQEDLLKGLFTSFAPYNQKMAFTLLSQEKQVIFRACDLKGYTQNNAEGHRLLHILIDEDDRQVLAFGTREAHNVLQLFSFPATVTNNDLNLTPVQKLPDMTHQSKFASAIYSSSTGPLKQRDLLIAVMEGRIVRIVRVGLNP